MTRVAAVDCGTNSTRLLIADVDAVDGPLETLVREMRITRLGAGVDRTRHFDPVAIERTLATLRDYAAEIERLGVTRTRVTATSATRDADNRAVFVDAVKTLLGVEPEVISGDEEARLTFVGATTELRADRPAPFLVVDIGGGSTEFVLGTTTVDTACSVDIGCVRLTERHLHGDPPTATEIEAAVRDIEAGIDEAAEEVPLDQARTLVGTAGSVTTVAGIALGLPAYDAAVIHRARIGRAQVSEVAARLLRSSHAERAAISVIHPGRVDVIAAGALVLDRVMARIGADEVLVSDHDILDGIARSVGGDVG